MISKAQAKHLHRLHQKKYRDECKLFIAEGPKIVNDLLNSKYTIKEIFATPLFKIQNSKFKTHQINDTELKSISLLSTPNEVFAVFEIPSPLVLHPATLASELVLVLDDIRDPGNFGTIIRIADWFGIKHIICSESCVDVYNPKVVQATMGSLASVDVYFEKLTSLMENIVTHIPDVKIFGTVLDGATVYSEKLSDAGIILIGNESRGISKNLLKYITHKISIPAFSHGADSLNAAIATAIICSEFKRNQALPK